jgi:hypothetical protein
MAGRLSILTRSPCQLIHRWEELALSMFGYSLAVHYTLRMIAIRRGAPL